MIELYQAEWCPYSRRVRMRLTELGVDFVARHVEASSARRNEMRGRTGHDTIPLLVTEDGEAISDFKAILRWLDEHHPENDETEPHREQIRSHGLEPTRPSG